MLGTLSAVCLDVHPSTAAELFALADSRPRRLRECSQECILGLTGVLPSVAVCGLTSRQVDRFPLRYTALSHVLSAGAKLQYISITHSLPCAGCCRCKFGQGPAVRPSGQRSEGSNSGTGHLPNNLAVLGDR